MHLKSGTQGKKDILQTVKATVKPSEVYIGICPCMESGSSLQAIIALQAALAFIHKRGRYHYIYLIVLRSPKGPDTALLINPTYGLLYSLGANMFS